METNRSNLIVNNNTDMNVIGLNEKEEFFNNILIIYISKPRIAYHIFSSEQKIEYNSHNEGMGKRQAAVSEMWKKLSVMEKEVYEKKHLEEVKKYEKNFFLVKKYLLNPDIFNDSRTPFTLYKEVFVHYYT